MVGVWRRMRASLAAMVLITACGGVDGPEAEGLATIEAAYAVYNTGDFDAWMEVRDRGSSYRSEADRLDALEWIRAREGPPMEAGARFEDIECLSHGEGSWPVPDRGEAEGWYFTCDATHVLGDGSSEEATLDWVVDDGEVVAVKDHVGPLVDP
jgi:hypothetical protein